jgi:molybdenum cofactor cytidylyltransferase
VVVVLGANAPLIKLEIADLPVFVAENPDWEEGMGSSIRQV